MADKELYIIDTELPDPLNFDAIKRQAIDQLKSLAGKVWSNYNESDPGVTILDQLCYALTELGYCAQFPIEDVLTQADGKIRYEGQFFEPQLILTSSPVTTDDYRKLVHDKIDAVEAIYITAECVAGAPTGRYASYLRLKNVTRMEGDEIHHLTCAVHKLLNQHRNLAEVFAWPIPLVTRPITLGGTIVLAPRADVTELYGQILKVLHTYGVAPPIRSGYEQLRAQGVAADAIFNGPHLQQGWIQGPNGLQGKRDNVNLFTLQTLLAAIDGVVHVEGLYFLESAYQDESIIAIGKQEIPEIQPSILAFRIMRNGVQVQPGVPHLGAGENGGVYPVPLYLSQLSVAYESAGVPSKVDRHPPRPQGRYRNIEQYYSVQNTFPDAYCIGHNSLQSDLPRYRVASSRQLKGYLMVYDQLLANQFSQLAHVADLFSFQPPPPAIRPADDALAYPPFAPTYFCQGLYDVPDVMPLLQGTGAFHYQLDPLRPEKLVERDAWKRYREQPFNAYMHGLRELMESASEAARRRDNMLSHLMARHGDQASLYDDMIKAGHWYGGEARTCAVVKSIWLQNYQCLSYRRVRAFDARLAQQLTPLDRNARSWQIPAVHYPTVDGQLDEQSIYSHAKLQAADFQQFSTFELKADILLGLSKHLLTLASKLDALLKQSDFEGWLENSAESQPYKLADSDLSVLRGSGEHYLEDGGERLMTIAGNPGAAPGYDDYRQHLLQLLWLGRERKGFLLVEHVWLLPLDSDQVPATEQGTPSHFLSASLVFPKYVSRVLQSDFQKALATLVEQHWPAHVTLRWREWPHGPLRSLIDFFVAWYNGICAAQRDSGGKVPMPVAPLAGKDAPQTPGSMLAKLLQLGSTQEAAHAS